jgi:hypothetical protein
VATFYGSDSSCLVDVGLFDLQITDPNILIGQRVARLLQTPRGGLGAVGDDANRGFDIRALINAKMAPSAISQIAQAIQNECEKDEEVQSAAVTLGLDANGALSSVTINLVSADGPFTLTANVQSITSSLVFSF